MKNFLINFATMLFVFFLISRAIFGEVVLPNTKLTISSNFSIRGTATLWDFPSAVTCSTQTGCVDVVFVVDTSGSMSDKVDELYTEIGEFANNLEAVGFDGAFGIVTFVDAPRFPYGDTLFHNPDAFAAVVGALNGAEGGFEAPIDASYEAIDRYFLPPPDTCQKVIVCITDETQEESTRPLSSLINIALAVDTAWIYLVAPEDHPMEPACDATGGEWFDIWTRTLDEVLDAIVDDVANFTAITIVVTNNTGGPVSDMTVEINPLSCIVLDRPADSIQHTGPLNNGQRDTITWQINELNDCTGCQDCFTITISTGSLMDTVIGCLFVDSCSCPGLIANVIRPRNCGGYTACDEIVFQFEGCFPVNPNTIRVWVNGTIISYPNPQLTYNPADQTLRLQPSTPWPDGTRVEFYVQDARDITGCILRYSQHCSFIVDKTPPQFDWGPTWSPACGTNVTSSTVIHFDACVHDAGVGMTMLDASGTLTAEALFSIFYSIYLEINGGILGGDSLFDLPGIPGLPGLGYDVLVLGNQLWPLPPRCDTLADSAGVFYYGFPLTNFYIQRYLCNDNLDLLNLCPNCNPCDWHVVFHVPVSQILPLLVPPVYEIRLCFHFQDLISASDCGPNDTVVCCRYYYGTCTAPGIVSLLTPTNGFTASCSTRVNFTWNPVSGSTPMYYDLYVNGVLVADSLTTTSYNYGRIVNTGSTRLTYTWYVRAYNPCGSSTSPTWTFYIDPCCKPARSFLTCPFPNCYRFSSCNPQQVGFFMQDTTGRTIDRARAYFTIQLFHVGGGSDIYRITGTDARVVWTGDTARVNWTPIADGDSVIIRLDSLFTSDGCKTVPGP